MTTIGLTILILFLLIIPGFFLRRIFQIWTINDFLSRICLDIALGFIWNMIIILIGIITGLNIETLYYFYVFGLIILLVCFLLTNRSKSFKYQLPKTNPKQIFLFIQKNSLWLLALGIFALTILLAAQKGSIFDQEAFFHLSIMRKAISGQVLSPINLGFTKDNLHLVYGLPVWHIFLSLISIISKIDIFKVWQNAFLPLSILLVTIWSWLLSTIFKNKTFTALSVAFLAIVIALFNNSYILQRLAIPNTLGLFILIPLIFGLTIKFIFERLNETKILITLLLLISCATTIHNLQAIYYFLILTFCILVAATAKMQKIIDKETWLKICLLWMICLVGALSGFVLLKNNINIYNDLNQNPNFNHLLFFSKITFILFPLILLLVRQNARLLFIFSLFLILPLIYSPATNIFQQLLLTNFGSIFLNRIDAYTTWDFAIWGIFLGLFLIFLDRYLANIKKRQIFMINIGLVVITVAEIFLEHRFHTISNIYNSIFMNFKLTDWINNYYWILLLAVITAAALIYIWKIEFKIVDILEYKIKNNLSIFLVTIVILFFFFSPSYKNIFNSDNMIINDSSHQKIDLSLVGGQETINFITTNIPPKSIFLATTTSTDFLSLLTDNYMAFYPRSAKEKLAQKIFDFKVNDNEKKEIIKNMKIEYIFLSPNEKIYQPIFDQYLLIYSGKSTIYKVNSN